MRLEMELRWDLLAQATKPKPFRPSFPITFDASSARDFGDARRLMTDEAATLIALLGLEPLPHEGGFYRRTWTSSTHLPNGRSAGSAITFLITNTDFSALHRLATDELWFFHAGDVVEHVQLVNSQEEPVIARLGANPLVGQTPQLVVPAGNWQGARLAPADDPNANSAAGKGWALMSCTMAPAWDEREFSLGNRDRLLNEFPHAADWIHALTRMHHS
jgi:predicted cupin superfamily sugar epimerase